jgi:hypothetical protein
MLLKGELAELKYDFIYPKSFRLVVTTEAFHTMPVLLL